MDTYAINLPLHAAFSLSNKFGVPFFIFEKLFNFSFDFLDNLLSILKVCSLVSTFLYNFKLPGVGKTWRF